MLEPVRRVMELCFFEPAGKVIDIHRSSADSEPLISCLGITGSKMGGVKLDYRFLPRASSDGP